MPATGAVWGGAFGGSNDFSSNSASSELSPASVTPGDGFDPFEGIDLDPIKPDLSGFILCLIFSFSLLWISTIRYRDEEIKHEQWYVFTAIRYWVFFYNRFCL